MILVSSVVTKIVFDTSSLLRVLKTGKIYELVMKDDLQILTTPEVVSELKDEAARIAFESVKDKIIVMSPKKENITLIRKIAGETGDRIKLSKTDIAVLALAYQEKAKIATEDFAIQNVAEKLGVEILSVLNRRIRKRIIIRKKCTVCKTVYSVELDECPECGSKKYILIRKKVKE